MKEMAWRAARRWRRRSGTSGPGGPKSGRSGCRRSRPARCGCARCYGAISRGTEALIAAGRVPESEYQRMRAPFMGGSFPFPVKYGYATVGAVEAGPAALIGRNVFALHPHQTSSTCRPRPSVPVPDDIPPSRAVLAANMETALNAVWDAAPGPSGRIAVVGAGVVGALVGYLCARIEGAEVTLVDIDPARAALARALGLNFAAPDACAGRLRPRLSRQRHRRGARDRARLAGDEATVVELSWYGAGDVPVPLGGAFHSRRLKLISSQVGKVAPSRRATFTHRQRLEAALELSPIRGSTRCWRRRSRSANFPRGFPIS